MNLLATLVSFLIVLGRKTAAQSVSFLLNGQTYANNSLIFLDDIGEDNNALHCHTTRNNCCKTLIRGEWNFPDGSAVGTKSSGADFYRNRDNDGNVKLHRRNNAQTPKGRYTCIIPDHRGIVIRVSVVLYSLQDYPEVVGQPQAQLNVDPGSSVSFSVTGVRSSNYHWYHNDVGIPDSLPGKYVGTRHSTLTVLSVSQSDVGEYSCVVGNSILSVLSDSAQLSLLPPPVIVTNPSDLLNVELNSDVTFSVDTEGLRLSFQWLRTNGGGLLLASQQRVVGVDTSTLTIHAVEVEDMGVYACEVYNAAGLVRSGDALLTVTVPEPPTTQLPTTEPATTQPPTTLPAVESLVITPSITSIEVAWTPPNFNTSESILFYELLYFPVLFPSHSLSLNTSLTAHEVTGLIPRLQYQLQLRVHTSLGPGEWLIETVSLDTKIPSVQNLSVVVTDGKTLSISWAPLTDLKGWNVSYYSLTATTHLPNQHQPESTLKRRVDGGRTSETVDADELGAKEGLSHMIEVVAVLEIKGVEGIGEVRGERAVRNVTLTFEKMPFQVMFGPVPYCITWEKSKANNIEAALQETLVKAIQTRCNCSFSHGSPLSGGVFSCRGSQTVATYRSSVSSLNATELVGYIQDWVDSNTTVVLDYYLADVYSSCPTRISRLDEPDCQL